MCGVYFKTIVVLLLSVVKVLWMIRSQSLDSWDVYTGVNLEYRLDTLSIIN